MFTSCLVYRKYIYKIPFYVCTFRINRYFNIYFNLLYHNKLSNNEEIFTIIDISIKSFSFWAK